MKSAFLDSNANIELPQDIWNANHRLLASIFCENFQNDLSAFSQNNFTEFAGLNETNPEKLISELLNNSNTINGGDANDSESLQNSSKNEEINYDLLIDDFVFNYDDVGTKNSINTDPNNTQDLYFIQHHFQNLMEESQWVHADTSKNQGMFSFHRRTNGYFDQNALLSYIQDNPIILKPIRQQKVGKKSKTPQKKKTQLNPTFAETFHNSTVPIRESDFQIKTYKYNEIQLPSWKKYEPGSICDIVFEYENTSDEAYLIRHQPLEYEEHARYLSSIATTTSNRKHSRGNVSNTLITVEQRARDDQINHNVTLYDEDHAKFY